MQEKLLQKQRSMAKEMANYETVYRAGRTDAETALLCWGSNKGVGEEVAENLGLRMVQPVVLLPFPVDSCRNALEGAHLVITVENNATGQLANLMRLNGFTIHSEIHKYDGRPFTVEELVDRVKEVLR
jgi:2-oxoglutarate ferredoxin oxidoreductase subunit alpha